MGKEYKQMALEERDRIAEMKALGHCWLNSRPFSGQTRMTGDPASYRELQVKAIEGVI